MQVPSSLASGAGHIARIYYYQNSLLPARGSKAKNGLAACLIGSQAPLPLPRHLCLWQFESSPSRLPLWCGCLMLHERDGGAQTDHSPSCGSNLHGVDVELAYLEISCNSGPYECCVCFVYTVPPVPVPVPVPPCTCTCGGGGRCGDGFTIHVITFIVHSLFCLGCKISLSTFRHRHY